MLLNTIPLKFKTKKIKREFHNPDLVEPRLIAGLFALGWYAKAKGFPPPVITCLARDFDGTNDYSPHVITERRKRCHAADIRAHFNYFTPEQEERLRNFCRIYFPRTDMLLLEGGINDWVGGTRLHGKGAHRHIHWSIEPLQQYLSRLRLLKP